MTRPWTRDPPTEPGHYWISRNRYVWHVLVWRHVNGDGDRSLRVDEGGGTTPLADPRHRDCWWMRAEDPPEPPEENEI